jgi:prevent-host-death family protein
MEQIGIRELRQHASVWVAKVKAGATIQIAERGRPVARLVPISADEREREVLIGEGQLLPAPNPRTVLRVEDLIQGPALSPILEEQRGER